MWCKKKKLVAFLIAVICILNVVPVMAKEKKGIPVSELEITSVQVNGETIYVPMKKSEVTSVRLASNITGEKVEFFIPVTDSAKQYNEKLIHDMKQRLTTTDQSLDSAGYMTATSVINYTKDYYNSHPRIKMTSFSVDNNKGVDSYLVGLGQPSATVYQLGYYGPGGHPEVMDQKKNYTFGWGKTQTVPSSWLPVCTDIGSHTRGIQYTATLIYSNGNNTTRTEKCSFFHRCG